jgi:hypothetical protein
VPFFLRRVTFARWQGQSPVTNEARAVARGDFALGEADIDGLSVFEADDTEDRQIVIAAIACARKNVDNVDLLEISDVEVRAFGTVVATPGGYPVPRANRLHRSLPWDQGTLNVLADRLLDLGRRATRYRKPDVKEAVAAIAVEEVQAGPHREWLVSLRKSS